jgi:acyl-CoA dehydrogenase
MDFAIPDDIQDTLDALDAFIEKEIKPLQAQDDNERFFDHRREWARTDFENDGVPRADWEALLREMRRRADVDRKSTRLNSSHSAKSRMPSSA